MGSTYVGPAREQVARSVMEGLASLDHRTVINLGRGSVLITLPAAWVRLHGVKAGDKLEVLSGERQLLVRIPQPEGGGK